jgi:hypothetical protein
MDFATARRLYAALSPRSSAETEPYGLEDEDHFLLVVPAYSGVFDAPAVFVDKRTGTVHLENYLLAMDKIAAMREIGPWPAED